MQVVVRDWLLTHGGGTRAAAANKRAPQSRSILTAAAFAPLLPADLRYYLLWRSIRVHIRAAIRALWIR